MKNTTKNKKTQTKGATIPDRIKRFYNPQDYERDILDIERKAEYFKKAVNDLLPQGESIKANGEFFNMLRRLLEAPIWQPFFVEAVVTTCLLADAFNKDNNRLNDGWEKVNEEMRRRGEAIGGREPTATLYGKYLDSITTSDEVKEVIAKIKKGEV